MIFEQMLSSEQLLKVANELTGNSKKIILQLHGSIYSEIKDDNYVLTYMSNEAFKNLEKFQKENIELKKQLEIEKSKSIFKRIFKM